MFFKIRHLQKGEYLYFYKLKPEDDEITFGMESIEKEVKVIGRIFLESLIVGSHKKMYDQQKHTLLCILRESLKDGVCIVTEFIKSKTTYAITDDRKLLNLTDGSSSERGDNNILCYYVVEK